MQETKFVELKKFNLSRTAKFSFNLSVIMITDELIEINI